MGTNFRAVYPVVISYAIDAIYIVSMVILYICFWPFELMVCIFKKLVRVLSLKNPGLVLWVAYVVILGLAMLTCAEFKNWRECL